MDYEITEPDRDPVTLKVTFRPPYLAVGSETQEIVNHLMKMLRKFPQNDMTLVSGMLSVIAIITHVHCEKTGEESQEHLTRYNEFLETTLEVLRRRSAT
jgi:hypothetical protein